MTILVVMNPCKGVGTKRRCHGSAALSFSTAQIAVPCKCAKEVVKKMDLLLSPLRKPIEGAQVKRQDGATMQVAVVPALYLCLWGMKATWA